MSNNYTYLGYGCGRAVVKLNNQNIVVKVPFNNCGVLQNESENELYNKGDNPYLAKVIDYDNSTKLLYMEHVIDKSKYFMAYSRDKILCEEYDNKANISYSCNADCFNCVHNILSSYIPKNIDEILKYRNLNDTIQIGINSEGEYRYFDYGNAKLEKGENDFSEEDVPYLMEYLETLPNETFEEYLISKRGKKEYQMHNHKPHIAYERVAREKWVKYMNRGNK